MNDNRITGIGKFSSYLTFTSAISPIFNIDSIKLWWNHSILIIMCFFMKFISYCHYSLRIKRIDESYVRHWASNSFYLYLYSYCKIRKEQFCKLIKFFTLWIHQKVSYSVYSLLWVSVRPKPGLGTKTKVQFRCRYWSRFF